MKKLHCDNVSCFDWETDSAKPGRGEGVPVAEVSQPRGGDPRASATSGGGARAGADRLDQRGAMAVSTKEVR